MPWIIPAILKTDFPQITFRQQEIWANNKHASSNTKASAYMIVATFQNTEGIPGKIPL